MNDKEHRAWTDRSDGDPSLLRGRRFVELRQGVRIVKDKGRGLEAKPMLKQVLLIFFVVPFETHGRFRRRDNPKTTEDPARCQYICMYEALTFSHVPT